MRTDSIKNYNPQFGAIYRIKHTNEIDQALFSMGIEPISSMITKQPMLFSQGKNPFEPALISYAKNIADNFNAGFGWITQNVSRYGKELPNPEDMEAWFVSGTNDVMHVSKFVKKYDVPGSFKYIIKKLFSCKPEQEYPEAPSHLKRLFRYIDEMQDTNKNFEKHMAKHGDIIECNDFTDFLEKFKFQK